MRKGGSIIASRICLLGFSDKCNGCMQILFYFFNFFYLFVYFYFVGSCSIVYIIIAESIIA